MNTDFSPGALLREAREAKSLDTREIAATLNVDPWMLDALEHDEYAALGAPVFAKGHLRKYAVALGLDEGDVLVAYYQREGAREAPPLLAESILRVESARARNYGWVAPALGVFVLAVVSLGAFLYFQPEDGADAAQAATVAPVETPAQSGESGERSRTLRLPTAAPETQNPTSSAPTDAATSSTAPASPADQARRNDVRESSASASAPNASSVSSPPTRQAPVSSTNAPRSGSPSARGNEPSRVAAATPEPSAPRGGISARSRVEPVQNATAATSEPRVAADDAVSVTLDFDGDSWVEIYDVNRRKLLYDMGQAGTRRSVTGEGPLQIFLGKAVDVSVRVDGEPYQIERISQRGTARFYAERRAR